VHPNVKLFISHGGIFDVYEAVDAGTPVLGFPVFFDQSRNLEKLVNARIAISLKLKSITKDMFLKSITELINNEK
jgi:glucuronosyltransferase